MVKNTSKTIAKIWKKGNEFWKIEDEKIVKKFVKKGQENGEKSSKNG